jgi:hypothetical protein
MCLYNDFMAFLKEQGRGPRPKRKGDYQPRVQIVGKTDQRTQLRVLCLAYENDMSAGELVDLLCHELVEDPKLLQRCLKRRAQENWSKRTKHGHPENYFDYPHMNKQLTAKEENACRQIVENSKYLQEPGSKQERRLEKLKELGRSRRGSAKKAA